MGNLTTHHLLFITQVATPLEVDDHSGSALRGNLYEAVWQRFCTNKSSPSCAACTLHSLCPVNALVAPLREENLYGRDIPRPYIILPPLGDARRYEPGSTLLFGVTLFGNIIQLLPYIMLSVPALETAGLGRKINQHNTQRGKFIIQHIDAYNPLSGERRPLYEYGVVLAAASPLAVAEAEVCTKAQQLSNTRITLKFLTPTRLIDREHLVQRAAFRPLIQRLLERLNALQDAYGTNESEQGSIIKIEKQQQRTLLELAEEVQCSEDATYWRELDSYSRRQQRSTPISGLLGQATFVGNLAPFRELLVWGELIHVGKNCVKGSGWYTIL